MKKNFKESMFRIFINRTKPTPPNFKRIPAKIIEPNVGASTCAIGSQK